MSRLTRTQSKAQAAAHNAAAAVYRERADELHARTDLLTAGELLELLEMDEYLEGFRDYYASVYNESSFLAHVTKRLEQDILDETRRNQEARYTRDEWRQQERTTYKIMEDLSEMTALEQNQLWGQAMELEAAAEKAELAEAQAFHDADQAAGSAAQSSG